MKVRDPITGRYLPEKLKKICVHCGAEFPVKAAVFEKSRYCSKKCYWINSKGRKLSAEHIAKISEKNRGKKRSIDFRKLLSELQSGENNSGWKGGISFVPEHHRLLSEIKRYGMIKDEALKKLGSCCSMCRMTNDEHLRRWGTRLHIHHKDNNGRSTNKPNNELDNLEVVCCVCHGKKHMDSDRGRRMRELQLI